MEVRSKLNLVTRRIGERDVERQRLVQPLLESGPLKVSRNSVLGRSPEGTTIAELLSGQTHTRPEPNRHKEKRKPPKPHKILSNQSLHPMVLLKAYHALEVAVLFFFRFQNNRDLYSLFMRRPMNRLKVKSLREWRSPLIQ
jgi:hypothetical protein